MKTARIVATNNIYSQSSGHIISHNYFPNENLVIYPALVIGRYAVHTVPRFAIKHKNCNVTVVEVH